MSLYLTLPRFPLALLRRLLPRAERDEVLADMRAEFMEIAAADGLPAAKRWLWRQALGSAPALLGWNWWRGWTGFEPRANAYRPGGPMFKSWITDARYAMRRLRARPTYTILSVLTLALGIGGTTAVFGVARPLLLDPLPYANANEVVTFWMPFWWNEEEFMYLRGRVPGFRAVGMYRSGDVTMREGDSPTRLLPGSIVSAELFDVLGAHPLLGRAFREPSTQAPNSSSLPRARTSEARGNSSASSRASRSASSPSFTAHTPRGVAATSTLPRDERTTRYRISAPAPPWRYVAGVMPSCASATSYARLLEPKPASYVARLTVPPRRSCDLKRSARRARR